MGIQVPLLVIDRRRVSVMSTLFLNHRVRTLKVTMTVIMRLCNSRLPEEHFVCYQTSQRNWVIIKELYRCLQKVHVELA